MCSDEVYAYNIIPSQTPNPTESLNPTPIQFSTSNAGQYWINGYTRDNGTYVTQS